MQFLRSLPLAALLAAGALTTTPARSSVSRQQATSASYQDGYAQGYRETQQNKCLDGSYFEEHYQANYLPRAQRNADATAGTADGPFYQGYLDGLQVAYGDPVFCN